MDLGADTFEAKAAAFKARRQARLQELADSRVSIERTRVAGIAGTKWPVYMTEEPTVRVHVASNAALMMGGAK